MSETLKYGLTPGGFNRMRMPEITAAIFEQLAARTGLIFDQSPRAIEGQIAATYSERTAAMFELAEAVYYSAFPATATGVSLDLAVSYAGVRRILDAPTIIPTVLIGTQGTLVPEGTVLESEFLPPGMNDNPRATLMEPVTITRDALAFMRVRFPSPLPANTEFWVEGAGNRWSVNSGSGGATAATLANSLRIQAEASGFYSLVTAGIGVDVDFFRSTPWAGRASPSLVTSAIGTIGNFAAAITGPVEFPVRSLTRIITGVSGLVAANNEVAGRLGTLREQDEELRARYNRGVFRLGAGTDPSILANMQQDIPGAGFVAVFSNRAETDDAEGRPPHSLEVVIDGGDDGLIARRIYELAPSGITLFGNTLVPVLDDTGFPQQVRFSRPEQVWIWLKGVVQTTSEEAVSGDVEVQAKAAIATEGAKLGTGRDVLLGRLEAAPFTTTTGIRRTTLRAARTAPNAGEPPDNAYMQADISIGSRERAVFDTSRIELV